MAVIKEGTFNAKGSEIVSYILEEPQNPRAVYVLAHGAGAGMTHPHLKKISETLTGLNLAVLRFNFLYMEKGKKSVGSKADAVSAIITALKLAGTQFPGLPLLAGGHSYGGRMTTHAVLEQDCPQPAGLVFFSFPLHAPGKPGTERAVHLREIAVPMLFLSGTRDTFARRDLLEEVCSAQKKSRLAWIDQADHSFRIPNKAGKQPGFAYDEAARALSEWLKATL